MTQGSFSHPASQSLTRLVQGEGGARGVKDAYGPLASLFGTWVGDKGWNLIAIPTNTEPKGDAFALIVRPYYEVITITPISAPVLNHGGPTTESIMGAEYSLQINDAVTNALLHVENGMWLLLGAADGTLGRPTIARQATIPHGDSVLAVGSWSQDEGPPTIPVVRANPTNTEGQPMGYAETQYMYPPKDFPEFHITNPFEHLSDALAGQDVASTVSFDVTTEPLGGINNIPFIRSHVDASKFSGTYWVETVQDGDQTFQQLQYAQITMVDFFQFNPTGKVHWPHMNLNTLVRLDG